MVLLAMRVALPAEWFGGGVIGAEHAMQFAGGRAESAPLGGQRSGVGLFHGTEAAIAAAVERRADRAAAGMGDGTEARGSAHHDADIAAQLAFDADTVAGNDGFAADQESGDHFQQLPLVDRAAAQF